MDRGSTGNSETWALRAHVQNGARARSWIRSLLGEGSDRGLNLRPIGHGSNTQPDARTRDQLLTGGVLGTHYLAVDRL